MLCENCGKRPAQKFIRNVDGKEVVVELCPVCFRTLYAKKPGTTFTSLMGTPAREDAACPVCGTPARPGDGFCRECGEKL